MRQTLISLLLILALAAANAQTVPGQQSVQPTQTNAPQSSSTTASSSTPVATLSPHGEKIKNKILKMGVGSKITVVIEDGDDLYGSVSKIDAGTFEIVEVDRQEHIALSYDKVKKVRSTYGNKTPFGGRNNPRVGYAILGGVLALIFTAAILAGASE